MDRIKTAFRGASLTRRSSPSRCIKVVRGPVVEDGLLTTRERKPRFARRAKPFHLRLLSLTLHWDTNSQTCLATKSYPVHPVYPCSSPATDEPAPIGLARPIKAISTWIDRMDRIKTAFRGASLTRRSSPSRCIKVVRGPVVEDGLLTTRERKPRFARRAKPFHLRLLSLTLHWDTNSQTCLATKSYPVHPVYPCSSPATDEPAPIGLARPIKAISTWIDRMDRIKTAFRGASLTRRSSPSRCIKAVRGPVVEDRLLTIRERKPRFAPRAKPFLIVARSTHPIKATSYLNSQNRLARKSYPLHPVHPCSTPA